MASLKGKVLETNKRNRGTSMQGCMYKGGDSDRRAASSGVIVIQYFAIFIAIADDFP